MNNNYNKYYLKYLKYKNKYIQNKYKLITQNGGSNILDEIINLTKEVFASENSKYSTNSEYFSDDKMFDVDSNFLDKLYEELNANKDAISIRDKMVSLRRKIKEFTQNKINEIGYQNVMNIVSKPHPKTITIKQLELLNKPIEKELEVKPIEKEPEVTPIEKEPEVTPIEKEPEVTPIEKKSEDKPIEKKPEVTPIEKKPEVTPIEKKPKVEPIEKKPEAKPIERDSDILVNSSDIESEDEIKGKYQNYVDRPSHFASYNDEPKDRLLNYKNNDRDTHTFIHGENIRNMGVYDPGNQPLLKVDDYFMLQEINKELKD